MSKYGWRIGDRVRFTPTNGWECGYDYTVEEIDVNGHIWGSDLPQPYYESGGTQQKNWHNPRPHFTMLLERSPLNKHKITKHKMV